MAPDYYANSTSVGESGTGDYTNYRTGTSGSYTTNRSYDPSTGNAQQGYTRGFATTGGTTGNVAREETYNASTGRYAYSSSVSATGKGGSSVSSTVTEGENTDGGTGAQRQTTTTNAQTGVTKTTTKSASTGRQGAEASKQTTYTDSKTGATATTTRGTGTGAQVSYNNPTDEDQDAMAMAVFYLNDRTMRGKNVIETGLTVSPRCQHSMQGDGCALIPTQATLPAMK